MLKGMSLDKRPPLKRLALTFPAFVKKPNVFTPATSPPFTPSSLLVASDSIQ